MKTLLMRLNYPNYNMFIHGQSNTTVKMSQFFESLEVDSFSGVINFQFDVSRGDMHLGIVGYTQSK